MYDSTEETINHIKSVNKAIAFFNKQMMTKGLLHDYSKLISPEKETFDEYTPRLKDCTYGSDEYKECLTGMKVALDHHYENNAHHPEHHKNGINDMSLFDLVEMFCDWCSATLRHDDGNLEASIKFNQDRFGYSDELKNIMMNTVEKFKSEGLCK